MKCIPINNQYSIFIIKITNVFSLKQSPINFIQSLLLVKPFSPSEIQASYLISLEYQLFFHLLPFKI